MYIKCGANNCLNAAWLDDDDKENDNYYNKDIKLA